MSNMLWLLFTFATFAAVQTPAAPPTGLLAGQVVDADTGSGVPGAIVRMGPPLGLTDASGSTRLRLDATTYGMRWVQADAQGRFVIRQVPNGSYVLAVTTSGYLLTAFDQQQPDGLPRPIVIDAAHDRHTGLVIKAWKYGAITGTVLDEAGEPAVGIDVRVLRRTLGAGRVSLQSAGTGQTDDRGVYRVSQLSPGDYVVAVPSVTVTLPQSVAASFAEAAGRRSGGGGLALGAATTSPVRPAGEDLVVLAGSRRALPLTGAYQTVFFPGVVSPADAASVTIRSGEERSGLDIRLNLVRTHAVSGLVSGREQVPGNLVVALLPAYAAEPGGPFAFETSTTMAAADGRFTFLGVPEGDYEIRILRVPPPVESMTPTSFQSGGQETTVFTVRPGESRASGDPTWWANMPISVRDGDVRDLRVPLRAGARISGRIEFRGSAPPPKPQADRPYYDVQLYAADGRTLPSFTAARADASMRFTTMQYPPGRYVVGVQQAPAPWILRSVTVNGRDALTAPFDLGNSDIADVVVTFTDRSTSLAGTVRAAGTAGSSSATVVLFPADVQAWIANGMIQRAFRTAATEADGAFSLPNLIPGDYLAAAIPADAPHNLQDSRTIAQLSRLATAVSLAEGDRKSVALTPVTIR